MVVETELYDILGVSTSATTEEISKTYKRLALKFHPDKTNHDERLTEKFKEITKAYEVLKDSKSRKIYDRYGLAGLDGTMQEQPAPRKSYGSSRGFGFSNPQDIFAQVFNDFNSVFNSESVFDSFSSLFPFEMHPGMSSRMNMGGDFKRSVKPADVPPSRAVRGRDIHHSFQVTIGDLYYGKRVAFQLPKNSKCGQCLGVGGINPRQCGVCKGAGQVVITTYNRMSRYQEMSSCEECRGTGVYVSPKNVCTGCNGEGYIRADKIIKVSVIPGSKNGDKILLQREGDEGRNIIPGDVIIHLKELEHPYLVRRHNDLYAEKDIDLKVALLGGVVTFNDFLRDGQDLKVLVNVHGHKSINNLIDSSLSYGEVVGTISPGEPKIVKNMGMPINDSQGVYFENGDLSPREDIIDEKNYKKGNFFIKFNIRLPTLDEFANGEKDLLTLQSILPPSNSNGFTGRGSTLKAHLSTLPSRRSNSGVSMSPSSESPPQSSTSGAREDNSDFEMSFANPEEVINLDSDEEFSDSWNKNDEGVKKRRRMRTDFSNRKAGIPC